MDAVWCHVYRAQGLFQRQFFFHMFEIVFLLAIKWKSIVFSLLL